MAQLELTSPRAEFHNLQGTMGNYTLAVFLVDFGETDSRLEPCCGQAARHWHRDRRQRLSQLELEERSRTKAELAKRSTGLLTGQSPLRRRLLPYSS